jgi:hypothetical protein
MPEVASLENCKELFELSGFGGKYAITKDGLVFSRHYGNWRRLKPDFLRGYERVGLVSEGKQKNYSVHRLVAQTFLPNPENKPQVNHIDCNPANNKLENLEWATGKENTQHAIQAGRVDRQKTRGEKHGMSKLTEEQAKAIKHSESRAHWLATLYGVSTNTIYDIKNGRRWKHV